MIHVNRNDVSRPRGLASDLITRLQKEAELFYSLPARARKQRRFKQLQEAFPPGVKKSLQSLFKGKCAYCERKLPQDEGLIDHFRPERSTIGQDGETYLDHYWWLASDWDNLLFSCPECCKMKGNRFPIEGPRAEILAEQASLDKELPLLLNPCVDDPEWHLSFDQEGNAIGHTTRAKTTITLLGLNRDSLLRERRALLHELRTDAERVARQGNSALTTWTAYVFSSGQPFMALRRGIFRDGLFGHLDSKKFNLKTVRSLKSKYGLHPLTATRRNIPVPKPIQLVSLDETSQAAKQIYYEQFRSIRRLRSRTSKALPI